MPFLAIVLKIFDVFHECSKTFYPILKIVSLQSSFHHREIFYRKIFIYKINNYFDWFMEIGSILMQFSFSMILYPFESFLHLMFCCWFNRFFGTSLKRLIKSLSPYLIIETLNRLVCLNFIFLATCNTTRFTHAFAWNWFA